MLPKKYFQKEITVSTDEMSNLSSDVASTAIALNDMTKNMMAEENNFKI